MNINELLDAAEEFLQLIHPNFYENYYEAKLPLFKINDEVSEFWRILGEFFDHIHPPPDFYE